MLHRYARIKPHFPRLNPRRIGLAFAASLAGAIALPAWADKPTFGIEGASVFATMEQSCTPALHCEKDSILPITNLTGDASVCIQPETESASYVEQDSNQLIQVYAYRNSCHFPVSTYLKLDGKWSGSIGMISPGQHAAVEVVHDTTNGNAPNVIMFCKTANGPRDDVSCR